MRCAISSDAPLSVRPCTLVRPMYGKKISPLASTMKPGATVTPVGSDCCAITAPAFGSSSGWSYTMMPTTSPGPMV